MICVRDTLFCHNARLFRQIVLKPTMHDKLMDRTGFTIAYAQSLGADRDIALSFHDYDWYQIIDTPHYAW